MAFGEVCLDAQPPPRGGRGSEAEGLPLTGVGYWPVEVSSGVVAVLEVRGVPLAVGVAVEVGVAVGDAEGVSVAVAVGVAVGVSVAVLVASGVAVEPGSGVPSAPPSPPR